LGQDAIAFAVAIHLVRQGVRVLAFDAVDGPLQNFPSEFAELLSELVLEIESRRWRDRLGEEPEDEANEFDGLAQKESRDVLVNFRWQRGLAGQESGEFARVVHDRVRAGGG
jgi:hypothetical protein